MSKTVATVSAAVAAMQPAWSLARALLGGTAAMRAAGEALLPRWPNETSRAHGVRLAKSVLFPAYQRTIKTLTGKPFSKPISFEDDVPKEIRDWCDDVDLQGRNLDAFAADTMEQALGYGLAGILVDYPTPDAAPAPKLDGVRTVADEKAAGLRPYMVLVYPWQILGWIAERTGGDWRLTQLRLMEEVEERDPADQFTLKCIPQIRVLSPGRWVTYRKSAVDEKEWLLFKEGVTTIDFVPFVPVYGDRKAYMVGVPPLVEVAHLNVKHWQSQSDQDNILHVARVPILVAAGVDKTFELVVGADAAVRFESPNSTLTYTEHTGAAIGAGKTALDDLKEEMRQAGAELLVLQPGSITATQVGTENAVGMCALQRITLGEQDALNLALEYMARYNRKDTGGHVKIFNDFGAATLAEASTQILLNATMNGKLSDETFFHELQRRGVISAERTWDEEQEALEAQGPTLGTVRTTVAEQGPGGDPLGGNPGAKPPAPPAPSPASPPAPAPKKRTKITITRDGNKLHAVSE